MGGNHVDLFEALEWSQWKNLAMEIKVQVISQVLMYFVSPLKQITDVAYCEFELSGVKCQTFECSIDGERFVLVPGNKEAILGWDLGMHGVATPYEVEKIKRTPYFEQLQMSYQLQTVEDWDIFINESTSSLRKVAIPPMLVQKEALPTGTTYIGEFNTITGEFVGNVAQFSPIEQAFRDSFKQPTSFEESLTWRLAPEIFVEDAFYAILDPATEAYRLYRQQTCNLQELRKRTQADLFDLLTEDQWEYVNGAGTRKLFRWGNESDSLSEKQSHHKMLQENMFGVLFDISRTRWELTDSSRLKLEKMEPTGLPLFDNLPLSSYYRSRKILSEEDKLLPSDFLYRKAIVIRSE